MLLQNILMFSNNYTHTHIYIYISSYKIFLYSESYIVHLRNRFWLFVIIAAIPEITYIILETYFCLIKQLAYRGLPGKRLSNSEYINTFLYLCTFK